jgi:polyphosphate kinase 2 (PPK2 family)
MPSSDGEPGSKLKQKEYDAALAKLHVELVKVQEWAKHTGAKICIIFEGRDGAGKGGTIKAITERVSPRGFPGHRATGADDRAGVERVMWFCTEDQVQHFLKVISAIEKAIVESGVMLIKVGLKWARTIRPDASRRASTMAGRSGNCR